MGAGQQNRARRAQRHGDHTVKPSRWRLLVDGSWRRREAMQGCGGQALSNCLGPGAWTKIGFEVNFPAHARGCRNQRDRRARRSVRIAIGSGS